MLGSLLPTGPKSTCDTPCSCSKACYPQESVEAPYGAGSMGQVVVEPWPAAYFPQCALLCGGGWQHRVERGTPWRPVRCVPDLAFYILTCR